MTTSDEDQNEEVARAMYGEAMPGRDWMRCPDDVRQHWRRYARVALDAAFAALTTPQEGDAREVPHIPYPGDPYNPAHIHDWADNACQSGHCMARPDGTTQPASRVAAPETEWEYATTQWGIDRQPHGRLTRGEITPEQWFAELGDREDLELVRRRKAGPWLPVGGDDGE